MKRGVSVFPNPKDKVTMMKHWHVIYTKPRNEIKVASRLNRLGLEVYCPTITTVRQWSDRKKKITLPLFSCYVFVKVGTANKNLVFEVPGVVRYLTWLGKPALVKDSEIATIKEWNDHDGANVLCPEAITAGDRVYIASGAFESQEAIIKEMGKNRLKLLLPALGVAVCLTSKTALKKLA
jgi:transcription antitermination factor NusG